MSQDFFDPEVYSDFVIEAREHLETIEPKLLELEKNPDNLSLLDDIFRPMHSLKGASGFLGLLEMNSLAHKGENILDELRKGRIKVTAGIMDLILEATDALREMVENLEALGNEGNVDTQHIIKHIDDFLEKGEEATSPSKTGSGQSGKPSSVPPGGVYALTMVSQDHLSDFLEEVREILAEVGSILLSLEKDPKGSQESINDLFRHFHNIKGNSAIIGFKEINELTHEVETLLNRVRNGEVEIHNQLVDMLLAVTDTVESALNNVDREKAEVRSIDISEILSQVRSVLDSGGGSGGEAQDSSAQPVVLNDPETGQKDAPVLSGEQELDIDPEDLQIFEQAVAQQFENIKYALEKITAGDFDKELVDGLYRSLVTVQNSTGYMGFDELKTYAQRTADLVDQGRKSDLDFALMADILKQEVGILESMVKSKLQSIYHPQEKSVDAQVQEAGPQAQEQGTEDCDPPRDEPALDGSQDAQTGQDQESQMIMDQSDAKDKSKPAIASTIRVDHSKLDDLMNLIGELIINRNRFAMLSKSLEEGHDVVEIAQQLTETTNSMARISDDLQVTIMNVRMVPVKSVFTKFPRLVRDLSRKSNKKVQLITEGEETELDKSVVELIGDPLVHLIRNSVDHGLEPEKERMDAGKEPTGTVWLRAAHRGNSVVIEVEDDGRGINPEKMKNKAVEKGIITQEEAQNMEDQEAIDLIFAPGFSTAEKVTDISGRGVGMDVVKNNIKNLKGNVVVNSNLGKGTRFFITLPLTLAIIDALMVRSGGQTYAIPLDAVSETTKIEAARLSEINNRKAVTLRGEVLGLADLDALLDLPSTGAGREVLPVVIITVGDRRLGLVVDTLLERQEVVIKSLGEYMGDQPGISGATIMGDGSVVLILDPHEVYKMATSKI
ncbi:chemotaxis protein CheA [Desulfonatronovibrio hydrogenovorans]|uniref:chemotaxis protein CheA n=1 Tax=Desulfonatronovibrio hydrogenovorans TaxID=53245 RepID=UPI00049090F4|nr:chemotaxis protein CheA [Desulfonatronovibrio hydrogenovorans]